MVTAAGLYLIASGHVIGVVVAKLDALRFARATGDLWQNLNFSSCWSEVRTFFDEEGMPQESVPWASGSRERCYRTAARNTEALSGTGLGIPSCSLTEYRLR